MNVCCGRSKIRPCAGRNAFGSIAGNAGFLDVILGA
jgi:hypothetical protein